MNWHLPNLLATLGDAAPVAGSVEDITARLETQVLPGTKVPPAAIEHVGADSWTQFYDSSYWFPEQASSLAAPVDNLFMYIFWVSLVFFIAIVIAMVYFSFKYRRKGGVIDPIPSSSHNTLIEIVWSVGPSVLLVYMFVQGASTYFDSRIAPVEAEEIIVTASRWNWVFTYPNGDSSSELHLVNNRPTRLKMQSTDVLHSFFVPAFRQKQDIVPGRYTYAYFQPTKTGLYRLSCNEYCGREHSKMRTVAEVHTDDKDRMDNTKWIKSEYYPWKNGERTYMINCSGCHKINGEAATGPALNLLYGMKERPLMDGSTVKVDSAYILESIWEPNAKVAQGFGPVSKMNSFKNKLSQDDVNDVEAFLKKLNDPASVAGGEIESGLKSEGGGDDAEPKADGGGDESDAKADAEGESDGDKEESDSEADDEA